MSPTLIATIFQLHLLASLAMVGLIWTIQWVHYPLFAQVGAEAFEAYHRAHVRRITHVVGPLMLLEAGSAAALLLLAPLDLPFWISVGLLALAWLSTALWQVPLHRKLEAGFDERAIRALAASNWLRTLAWTARAALLLWGTSLAGPS